jgi:hypothetical protein
MRADVRREEFCRAPKKGTGGAFRLDHRTSQVKLISVDVDYEAFTQDCGCGFPAKDHRTEAVAPNAQVFGSEDVTKKPLRKSPELKHRTACSFNQ